jgi:hypothetical protein
MCKNKAVMCLSLHRVSFVYCRVGSLLWEWNKVKVMHVVLVVHADMFFKLCRA